MSALVIVYVWLADGIAELRIGLDRLGVGASLASFSAEAIRLLFAVGLAGADQLAPGDAKHC